MSTFVFRIGGANPDLYSLTDNTQRTDNNIPLDAVIAMAEMDPIWAHRGKAIQGYAQLESALCFLMSSLGNIPLPTATTIFYKITSTGSRNSILEKLLHEKHGSKFNLFWNAYFKELRPIDLKRNEIVHWLAAANAALNVDNMLIVGVTLIPTASVGNADTTGITSTELIAFQTKCDEFARLAAMFVMATQPESGTAPDSMEPWLDIFQQP